MNVTDIDDKISRRAAETGVRPDQLARRFEQRFFEDLAQLGVDPPTHVRRVTDHVPHIKAFINELLQTGYAYALNPVAGTVPDSNDESVSVYLDSTRVYRESAHPFLQGAPSAAHDPSGGGGGGEGEGKRNPIDCCLWKGQLDRPGWHIECSAIARGVFGDRLDVHVGGADLRFPHHENEILQCEALRLARGRPLHQHWPQCFLHIGHVRIKGRKMSKSLKNFITIREFLNATPSPASSTSPSASLRWFCLLHRYDQPVEWSDSTEANQVAQKFDSFLANLAAGALQCDFGRRETEHDASFRACIHQTEVDVTTALLTNFNTPVAIQEFMNLIKKFHVYQNGLPSDHSVHPLLCHLALNLVHSFYTACGLPFPQRSSPSLPTTAPSALSADQIQTLQAVRTELRNQKLFSLSDQLRSLTNESDKKL